MDIDTSGIDKIISALSSQDDIRASVANSALSGGMALMQQKKYTQAAKVFQQAASLQPDNIDAYNLLGQAYSQLGKRKEAEQAYTISLKLDNTQDQVYTNLANVYIDDKKYSQAEQALKAASKNNPADPLSPYTLGQLYLMQGKLPEAQTQFLKTIRLSPNDGNPYYGLGATLSKMGKYDDAIKQLQKATQLKKDFSPALFELGKAYIALGQEDDAQVQLDKLKKIDTGDAQAAVDELTTMLRHPKMLDLAGGSFQSTFSTVSLAALGVELVAPGASKDFTMTFQFDSNMDVGSVMNVNNWNISKSKGGTAGLYDDGMYRPTDVQVPITPKQVVYDAVTSTATVIFSLSQNADGTGTIDPKHIVFKFMGTDLDGKKMDSAADQYDGFAKAAF